MQTIKINFSDFWPGFNPLEHRIFRLLKERYWVEISDQPEYLFFCDHGFDHLNYNCIKIYYSGENTVPDFNLCDYAVASSKLQFGDRYLRIPLCGIRSEEYEPLRLPKKILPEAAERKFCNFVYSNSSSANPFRLDFFHRLNKYKKIDSGGKLENNIGGRVGDKAAFQSQYKFSIAFESVATDGYITEKIIQPMLVSSMPIYWGSPSVSEDFNEKSFVHVKDSSEAAANAAIDEIVHLDTNPMAYIEKLSLPWIIEEQYVDYQKILAEYLYHIVDQPFSQGRRLSQYGRTIVYKNNLLRLVNKCSTKASKDIKKSSLASKLSKFFVSK